MLQDLLGLWPLLLLLLFTTLVSEWAIKSGWVAYWVGRKVLHCIAVGACALAPLWVATTLSLLYLVFPLWLLLLYVVGKKGLMRDEADGRIAWGIIWFPMAYLLLLYMHAEDEVYYGLAFPMAVLALCDPLATVIGKTFAKRQYQLTGDPKSLLGSLAFLVGFLLLGWGFGLPWSAATLLSVALLVTAAEALGSDGLDNLYIPLATAFFWWCSQLYGQAFQPFLPLLLMASLAFFAIRFRLLTLGGAVAAAMLGMLILSAVGPLLLFPLLFFFGSSVLISKLLPNQLHSDEKANKARDHVQVVANGGLYGLLCLFLVAYSFAADAEGLMPSEHPLLLLLWISAAAATADTWSSELGKYFGGTTYDILRWKQVHPGLSGGVSWLGSLGGLLGAAAIGWLYVLTIGSEASGANFLAITSLGCLGMLLDSILGSGLQRQYYNGRTWQDSPCKPAVKIRGLAWMSNDMVNVLANAGAVFLAVLYLLFT